MARSGTASDSYSDLGHLLCFLSISRSSTYFSLARSAPAARATPSPTRVSVSAIARLALSSPKKTPALSVARTWSGMAIPV